MKDLGVHAESLATLVPDHNHTLVMSLAVLGITPGNGKTWINQASVTPTLELVFRFLHDDFHHIVAVFSTPGRLPDSSGSLHAQT